MVNNNYKKIIRNKMSRKCKNCIYPFGMHSWVTGACPSKVEVLKFSKKKVFEVKIK